MLLHILQCMGQPPQLKELAQYGPGAEVEEPRAGEGTQAFTSD